MKIAIDAMGGDIGPSAVIPGAIAGARAHAVGLVLVGDESVVRPHLESSDTGGVEIEVVHTTETIEMDDHPAQAVRRKKDNSIRLAIRQIKDGTAEAMFSAGNSGAIMAAALMELGRIRGVDRPAISGAFPTLLQGQTLMLDIGAVTDPKPLNMVQNAIMGNIFAREVMGVSSPRVALLSNGEEDTKGNQLVIQVHQLLRQMPGLGFVGNVEGRDLLTGQIDVCVMDGFVGNVVLKTIEGTASMLLKVIRQEVTSSPIRKVGGLILKPAFRDVAKRLDAESIGGAPLLGVNGNVLIGHGSSSSLAVENAIGQCVRAARNDVAAKIRDRVAEIGEAPVPQDQ